MVKLIKKQSPEEKTIFYENINLKNKYLLCEIKYDLLYNVEALTFSKQKVTKLRSLISPHKKQFQKSGDKKNMLFN